MSEHKDAYGNPYTTSDGKKAAGDGTRVNTPNGPGSIHGGIVHTDKKSS